MISDEIVEQAAIKAWIVGEDATLETWRSQHDNQKRFRCSEARAVLEYAATLGPSREERLMWYRHAYASRPSMPVGTAEDYAHAMLAAERPAEPATPGLSRAVAIAAAAVVLAYANYKGNIEGPGARDLTMAHEALKRLVVPNKETP